MRRALQKYIEDPLSEALIQGLLPRPGELEVFLGDTGIFYRALNVTPAIEGEVTEPVETGLAIEPSPGTLLFTF